VLNKREIRQINREHWDRYVVDFEYDVHGCQDRAYNIIKGLNKTDKNTICLNPIPLHKWAQYYQELSTIKEEVTTLAENEVSVNPIALDGLLLILKSFKIKRAPITDKMNIELIKRASLSYLLEFMEFLNTCFKTGSIPGEWKEAVISPIFKKGKRIECFNCRVTSLLNSCSKIYSKNIIKQSA
jgi:hypothetical protein